MLIDQARLMEDLAGVVRKQPILFSKQLQQRQRADGVHIFSYELRKSKMSM